MEHKYLDYKVSGDIAWITVNRPDVRNAMNSECWAELADYMDMVEGDAGIRVAVLTGAGEKAFIAGADVGAMQHKTGLDTFRNIARTALQKVEDCSKPVIAAINGVAFGGGMEAALACDIRIAVPRAVFGLPETNLGIIPGAGGTQRLARVVGVGRAKEIILAGRTWTAAEAVAAGLVMEIAEPEELVARVEALAAAIRAKGPVAIAIAKQAINVSLDVDRVSGQALENLGFAVLMNTEDKLEGTTAFLEKRPAHFKGK